MTTPINRKDALHMLRLTRMALDASERKVRVLERKLAAAESAIKAGWGKSGRRAAGGRRP